MFEGRDLDGPAVWTSPAINITGFSDIRFAFDISESGALEETGSNFDYLDVSYLVDGSSFDISNQNGHSGSPYTVLGDFDSDAPTANQLSAVEQSGITGDTLQVSISMQNWANLERIRFDNFIVEEVPFDFAPNFGLVLTGVWVIYFKYRQQK